jgi:Mg-chelatase subunit ChlD
MYKMRKNTKGYVAVVILVLIAVGFLLTGGLISVSQFSSSGTDLYKLVDDSLSFPPKSTLQLSSLDFEPQKICGLAGFDIALVIDNSGSIDNSSLSQMKNAIVLFTTALSGTPTQFSVTSFGSTAQVVQGFTDNINTVNNAINSIREGGGSTNWQDALIKAKSTLPNRTNPDLVIFTSDGNPNTTGPSGERAGESQAVGDAVAVANAIKQSGAKILALGIGNDLNVENLKAISGPIVGNDLNADVVISDFNRLADDLAAFAKGNCGVGQS